MSLIVIIFVIPILFFRYRNGESKIENEKNEEIVEIEGKLQEYINKRISREELDEILEISNYSYETIKKRRSLLINQINGRNVLFVERLRNQDDKRYFEYKITKS
jgi:tRNA G10  N-methylase Trm11